MHAGPNGCTIMETHLGRLLRCPGDSDDPATWAPYEGPDGPVHAAEDEGGETAAIVGSAASDVRSEVLEVGAVTLPYAGALLVVVLGWRWARARLRGA